MASFVFLGREASIAGKFNATYFGQVLELPQDVAEFAIADDCPLLPKSEFDAIFNGSNDADELKKFYSTTLHEKASGGFLAKRAAAWLSVSKLRDALRNPVAVDDDVAVVHDEGVK